MPSSSERAQEKRSQLKAVLAGAACIAAIAGVAFGFFRRDPMLVAANTRIVMCAETHRAFPHELVRGEEEPYYSPYSQKRTAWRTEQCFWTRDGKVKKTPTYVILNSHMGVNQKTFCPDCGREVVGHNPPPPPELMARAQDE